MPCYKAEAIRRKCSKKIRGPKRKTTVTNSKAEIFRVFITDEMIAMISNHSNKERERIIA